MTAVPPGSGNRAVSDRAAVDAYVSASVVDETARHLHEARARFDALEAAGGGASDESALAWREVEVAATAHSAALDAASRAATIAALSRLQAAPADLPAPMMDLQTSTLEHRCTVTLRGEFDMAAADEVEGVLVRHLRDPGVEELHVDLAGVTFLDSSGLRALVRARVEADARHRRLVLENVGDRIRRTLEFARLDQVFAPS